VSAAPTETVESPSAVQEPEFQPVSIQHLAIIKTCDCCYYNSSTDGCSSVVDEES
jgi:hypothetical protein